MGNRLAVRVSCDDTPIFFEAAGGRGRSIVPYSEWMGLQSALHRLSLI
jgi:hypothetical protein